MKRLLGMLFVLVCLGLFAGAGPGMPTISIGEEMKIDAIGDGAIGINLTLTAAQYANWNQKYGPNKSLLKRDMGKFVSQYDTYDWEVKSSDMDRTVSIGIKAHGLVTHLGNGRYEFDVPKDWKGGDRNGNTVSYNFVETSAGLVEQFNCKVTLPPEARDVKEDTGESGQRVLRYAVPVASKTHWIVLSLGALISLGGLGIMVLGLIVGLFTGGRKSKAPAGL